MNIFKPLYLLMVLFVSAAFAADGGTASRTVSPSKVLSGTESVVSRSTERTASRDNGGEKTRVTSRGVSRDVATEDKSVKQAQVNVIARSTSAARGATETSARKTGEERNATTAKRVGVTARANVSETGRRITTRNTASKSNTDTENNKKETRVATSVTKESIAEAKGVMQQAAELNKSCQDQYNECMDQFCAIVDSNQKRCSCSANLARYNKVEEAVNKANSKLNEIAQSIRYVGLTPDEIRAIMSETEAEEVLSGKNDNTQNRNILERIEKMIKDPTSVNASYSEDNFDLQTLLDFSSDSSFISLDFLNTGVNSFSNLRGSDLYNAARSRCNTVLKQCQKAGATISQITGNYDLLIDKDCATYESGLEKMNSTLISNVDSAERLLQQARLAVLENKNQYDIKECVAELETCMTDDMVCGSNYSKCADPTKTYIDGNGDVVLGRAVTQIQSFMDGYNNALVDKGFLEDAYSSSTKITADNCSNNNGKCFVKYLMQKIGTKQKSTDEGLCRPVLDKCQYYTYKNKEYQPYNEVVVNYIQRAMIRIKSAQQKIISDYASSCLSEVASCYNQQVTQVNSWSVSATSVDVYSVMRGACRNLALTCGTAVFVGAPYVAENITINGDTYLYSGCAAVEGKQPGSAQYNNAIIDCVSSLFYQELLCPENSTYVKEGTVDVNGKCKCNTGYEAWSGKCLVPCDNATQERNQTTGACMCKDVSKVLKNGVCVDDDSTSGSSVASDGSDPLRYRLNYSCDGSNNFVYSPSVRYNEQVITEEDICSKAGYTFIGWSLENTDTIIQPGVQFQWTYPSNKTLTAVFEPNTYRLAYDCVPSEGGVTVVNIQNATVRSDEQYTPAGAQTCNNQTRIFGGWDIYSEGGTKVNGNGPVSAPFLWRYYGLNNALFTFRAIWNDAKYTVAYDANKPQTTSGSVSGSMVSSQFTVGQAQNLSENKYTLVGYTFNGWNTKANGTGVAYANKASVNFENAQANDTITLYAQWTPIQYHVAYILNDGAFGANHPTTVTYDTEFTVNNPTRQNYTFAGWNITQMDNVTHYYGSETTTKDFINGTMATTFKNLRSNGDANVSFSANWTAGAYTITFDANGASGSASPASKSCNYDSADCTLAAQGTLSKEHYVFGGWCTNSNGTGTCYAAGETVINLGTKTLYAKWTIGTYTITFNANGASGSANPTSKTCNYDSNGCTLAAQGTMSKANNTFGGWCTNSNGTGTCYAAGEAVTNLGTITLYAKWTGCQACTDTTTINCTISVSNNTCTYTTTCKEGYSNIQNNGKYNATCSTSSTTCNAGQYLPANSTSCQSCPAGKYCVGGTFAYSSSEQGITGNCNLGSFSTGGASAATCTKCSSLSGVSVSGGTYTTDSVGSTSNTACKYTGPAKTECYSSTTSAVTYTGSSWPASIYTVSAKAGYVVQNNGTASATCVTCTDNTIQPDDNFTGSNCLVCGTNQYANAAHTACEDEELVSIYCHAGEYLHNNECTICPAGYYCEGGTLDTNAGDQGKEICPAGKYSGIGASSCSTCPAGKYSSRGASSCNVCVGGKYSLQGASSCLNINAGYYSTGGGTSATGTCLSDYSCGACNGSNQYSNSGASSCSTCSSGQTPNSDHTGCESSSSSSMQYSFSIDLGSYGGTRTAYVCYNGSNYWIADDENCEVYTDFSKLWDNIPSFQTLGSQGIQCVDDGGSILPYSCAPECYDRNNWSIVRRDMVMTSCDAGSHF